MRKLAFLLLLGTAAAQTALMPMPRQCFNDSLSTGRPLAGGKIYTYQAGTSVQQATFTDSTGISQNTNPVILDLAGCASIWLTSGQAYRFVAKNSAGAQEWVTDNVSGLATTSSAFNQAITTVTYSATPTFTASAQYQVFKMTLTGNVTSSNLVMTGVSAPSIVTFEITQDNVGGHSFTWPLNSVGAPSVGSAAIANSATAVSFVWDGSVAYLFNYPSGNFPNLNGIYNAASCSYTSPPSWCAGTDIGAWINAAITAGASTVFIPQGSYSYTTSILMPRWVKLVGSGANLTSLNYTAATGWAVVVADSTGGSLAAAHGAIEDLTINGTGWANQTGGIYVGGSDGIAGGTGTVTVVGTAVTWATGTQFNTNWSVWQPITFGNGKVCLIANIATSTSLTVATPCAGVSGLYYVSGSPSQVSDPSTNFGDNVAFNRVRVLNFPVGMQWGNNSWLHSITQSNFSANATGIFYPSTVTVSGENESIANGSLISSNFQGIVIGQNGNGDIDFHLTDSSFDFNQGWGIANGNANATVEIKGGHTEQLQQWIKSLGPLQITDHYFTGGTNSGTVGYLIDNENTWCAVVNSVAFNVGAGTTFNSAGLSCTLLGFAWNGPGLGSPAGYSGDPATVLSNSALFLGTATVNGLTTVAGLKCAIVTKTANYTITNADCIVQASVSGGSFALTLNHALTGQQWTITRTDASGNTLTINADSGTVNGAASITVAADKTIICHADGTNTWCTP
jgi:hypothetical protein